MTPPSIAELFLRFCLISVMAVGGASAVLPEMHRQIVEVNGWISSAEFATLYAITQAAPGPNVLIVSLIGWKLAGITGAIVTTIAMCGPTSLLAFGVGKLWDRFSHSPWRKAIERGLAPITIGLIFGSGCLLVKTAGMAGQAWTIYVLAGASALASYYSRLNPLWWLALAAVLGMALF
ncbi:MAG TPA: chromate transporter [Rhodocyclaceae bacterium]|nr:chromate transporter [Rhodocyclaceae bacterium]